MACTGHPARNGSVTTRISTTLLFIYKFLHWLVGGSKPQLSKRNQCTCPRLAVAWLSSKHRQRALSNSIRCVVYFKDLNSKEKDLVPKREENLEQDRDTSITDGSKYHM